MFCTALHNLKSPDNVGMIVRSHVAFGGGPLVLVGQAQPWRFKKGTQAYSRRLEQLCEIIHIEQDDQLFTWCRDRALSPIAVEIDPAAADLRGFRFPKRTALILGSEAKGLPPEVLARCDGAVRIPQFGAAECLNVAVAAAVGMYEFRRDASTSRAVAGSRYCVAAETAEVGENQAGWGTCCAAWGARNAGLLRFTLQHFKIKKARASPGLPSGRRSKSAVISSACCAI